MPTGVVSPALPSSAPNAWHTARRPGSMEVDASAGGADHVAHCIDVRAGDAELLVDLDQTALASDGNDRGEQGVEKKSRARSYPRAVGAELLGIAGARRLGRVLLRLGLELLEERHELTPR